MKKSNLTFVDAPTGRVVSGVITYDPKPGRTECWSCPLHKQFPGEDWRSSSCAPADEINYDYMLPLMDDEVPFRDKENENLFCKGVKIVGFDTTRIEDIDVCRKKYSLKNLLQKVCSGRCILLDNPKDCTEEHRKCPGCLLGELDEN